MTERSVVFVIYKGFQPFDLTGPHVDEVDPAGVDTLVVAGGEGAGLARHDTALTG